MSRTTSTSKPATLTSIDRGLHSPSKLPSYRFIDARLSSIATQHPGIEPQQDTASTSRNTKSRQVSNDTPKPRRPPFIYDSISPTSVGPCINSPTSLDPVSSFMSNGNTRNWVEEHSISVPSSHTINPPPKTARRVVSLSIEDMKVSSPKISPIRQFKPSRNSTGSTRMAPSRRESDEDTTIRALEGLDRDRTPRDQDEQNSDDSDLFLNMAKEEEASRPRDDAGDGFRATSRKSRLSVTTNRMSMPPSVLYQASPRIVRRDTEQESTPASRMEGLTPAYRPSLGNKGNAGEDSNKSRYGGIRPMPTTPRGTGDGASRDISPESQVSHAGRRPSIPDHSSPSQSRSNSYRQSNLSYSSPRNYNSSPLVSRSVETNDNPETPRVIDGTESTISTTAPSTVWDELEELKSRIHRLELTGKLPATSGAAVSNASANRPPTATTTVTTLSSSPKRGRGNSISLSQNPGMGATTASAANDNHPLLQAALVKSKTLLDPEVYKALEATTADALAIAAMMGTSGQPGPISSSQSTIGGASAVSDRQVRRKADSLCRSLTELCLAMSEAKNESRPANNQVVLRPTTDDEEVMDSIETSPAQARPPISNELSRIKASPRALSRLEARRSSMLSTTVPSPRYTPSESGTPTQSMSAGRRASLYLRSRRAGTEEAEGDETQFRTPSRVVTDISRAKNSPKEYTSTQPLPELRSPAAQSSLPVRRHYASVSMPQSGLPTPQAGGPRRFLDRTTPDRDTSRVVSRIAEDRTQRKSSIGGGFGLSGLARRARQSSFNLEQSPSNQNGFT